MVWMTTMEQCRLGEHDKCPVVVAARPGEFGGVLCDCSCHRPSREENERRAERDFWRAMEDSRDPTELEFYLREFPDGAHAEEVRGRLRQLKAQEGRDEPEGS